MLTRYVDEGRKDRNVLKILRGVFRGGVLDRHAELAKKGEGDVFYIFYTSLRGDKRQSRLTVDGKIFQKDGRFR